MIKFHDPSGTPHFGQATITRTTSVNGGLSLTGEVFAGDDVLNGLDYGWWLNFDNEKYVITYKKLSDDTNTVVFDAVQQFFWDFAKVALHAQYTGSHEYTFYLGQLFDKSGYTYKNDVTVPAFEKENWGYKNKLDLFNDIIDQAGVEFEVHNETVHIAKQIGSDLTSFARKGINLSDLTEEMKISDFATYAKGYGAFKDAEDQSKGRLEVEYRSELAKQFGDLEMDPIVDERYTIADNLIAALKKQVDATYTVSMTMNIYDLENAGYPNYEAPKVGDWILAIDEALNFKRKIRIIQLEEQFDVTGKRIGYTATCGDLSIVDQYTHLQSSLDSKVQRIQESIDSVATSANGKNKNYYGAKEPVNADEGDLWFDQSNSDPDKWSIKQWVNGRWEQLTLNTGEVDSKVSVAKAVAETAIENAQSASDKADQLASKYDDTNSLANQALGRAASAQSDASSAISKAESTASEFGKVDQKAGSALTAASNAQNDASSAIAKAESTASEFGKVSQKTESALSSALNAQSDASDAVKQASSAAADSKDAKQIAGAVSQSYKKLTDGSTMTIAELESGLAVKLTKTDLDGYATQTWAQNQIKMTADGINGTISSVKSTVDGQTTSINDLKADSSSFKSQFTTVNNTLGKQTTDIGSLQATSKELTTGFNTLTTDNNTNKNDISQLRQTATEVSSTLETVKTQVQNSAVGTNLLLNSDKQFTNSNIGHEFVATTFNLNDIFDKYGTDQVYTISYDLSSKDPSKVSYIWAYTYPATTPQNKYFFPLVKHNGITTTPQRFSMTFKPTLVDKTIPRTTLVFYGQYDSGNIPIVNRVKVEKGSLATDWCPNPADNATVTAFSQLSQTVDGMKSDISRKIEQKDLNGYATQTWTQNQIKVTADGINSTLSSVKTTVDGQTTSINDLKADSNSFKSQFTTVNNTLGKQTTDIGTLQATSKELTTGFNTLTTDNTTNKNDISQLKQTATEVSSTVISVSDKVDNMQIGGRNYYQQKTLAYVIQLPTSTYNPSFTRPDADCPNGFMLTGAQDSTGTVRFKNVITGNGRWTVSFWMRSNQLSAQNLTLDACDLSPVRLTTSDDSTWKKYIYTVDITNYSATYNFVDFSNMSWAHFLIKDFKVETGNKATDWTPAPEDMATVTALSKLSQTVDGMQLDISKKIEQKDLNGYATQAWTQNQIKITADGINATLSSVKTTVDGHATSINDLKADSSGFKAQFTTVNDTIGKHTTDIGTLQSTTKSLSASFDSLSTDNNTNKHDISQLQASATAFNSTLMTVQQQVTDSAVGTNLLLKTYNPFSMTGNGGVNQATLMYALSRRLEKGTTVTLSFDAISTASANFTIQNSASGDGGTWMQHIGAAVGTTKKHYVATIKLDGYSQQGVYFRVDNMPLTTTITISNMKLELGSNATDYSENPADNATVDAVSSISQTVDAIQTTVRGKVDNDVYQSKMTQLDSQITTVVGQVNSLGQKNLIANSQFQYDWQNSWSISSHDWANWYTSNFTWAWLDGYQGICANIPQSQSESWPHIQSSDVAVPDPGVTAYSASVYVNIDWVETYCVLDMSFYNAAGVRTFHDTTASNKGLNFLKLENIVSPKDAVRVHIELHVHDHGHAAFIEPMFVQDSSVGKYIPDNASWTEVQQTYNSINLKVSKDGVVNAVNISPEGIQIYGNKLHITAATYIDNAVIKDAMIANLNANKLTAGSINAANINVYNINGANIVANSITADKLQAESMLIAMNSTLQTLKIGTDGLYTTNNSGTSIGKIHANNLIEHPGDWGLHFDLASTAQYMAWGAQNEGDPNGGYVVKFGWTRSSSAGDFTMPWGGFWFNDNVMLHKNLRFNGGGIDVDGAYQLMKFAWIQMNGTKYPFFGGSALKAGWLFGSSETYLVRDGGIINASKILGILNGQHYKFIKDLNSNGTVKGYVDVNF
ncbi:phage tail protein [Lactiplantibacillus plantarum]